MLGRIRASPSPVEMLELERLPSKISKDDHLSIYEATLVKLQQGSQRSLSSSTSTPTSQDSVNFELNSNASEDSPKTSGLSCEQGVPDYSGNGFCNGVSPSANQELKSRAVSIHYLFSKYASSRPEQGLASSGSGSLNVCSSSSDSESTGCSTLEF